MDREQRFTTLFDAYAPQVHRYLRRRAMNPSDVDDLVADVFMVAWRRLGEIPRDAELPWLYKTAWLTLANHRRRVVPLPVGDAADVDRPVDADPADVVIEDALLAEAWHRLSTRDREVLRLTAWEGLDGTALAAALGISTGGAAAALSRARARLAEALAEAEMESEQIADVPGIRNPVSASEPSPERVQDPAGA